MIIKLNAAIGDTVGLTSVLEPLYKETGIKPVVSTSFPEIFYNNPFVDRISTTNETILLEPCKVYSCNIVQYYANRLGLKENYPLQNRVYLTRDEVLEAKNELKELNGIKIAVCLFSSADSKDLRYEYIKPMLRKLKSYGAHLIFFGTKHPNDQIGLFSKSFIGKYGNNLRRLFALMNECDLYVGVDTGLFHIANALSIPQIVFFRNNECSNNAYKDTIFFDSQKECPSRCLIPFLGNCRSEERCMDTFDLEQYYNKIIEVIDKIKQ